MKLIKSPVIKSLAAAMLCLPLVFAGCASNNSAEEHGVHLEPSQHKEIPDTSSKKVTTPQDIRPELTALEASKEMGNGINLGNTMEAYRAAGMGTHQSAKSYEVLWGQPVTTPEFIKTCKKEGFDSIRVPVAWTNAVDYENGDYIIDTQYLDRIEEIVNYAIDADMYVIINDHWDGGWWGMFGSARDWVRADARELYTTMWTQIANRFKNYGYRLIFEGGNEEIGDRLNDSNIAGDSGTLKVADCYKVTNEINQMFVNTVRSTGGNNEQRLLLIPGYNTDITATCDSRYVMPEDTAKSKLLVSVHYYTPSNFCLGGSDVWGTVKQLSEMNNLMEKMSKFTDEGYGVIIGEFGALPYNDGSKKTSAGVWTQNLLDNADLYNYVPVLWDIGEWGFVKRGNKGELGFVDEEMKDIFASRSRAGQKEASRGYAAVQDAAEESIETRLDEAPAVLSDNPLVAKSASGCVAWIMYTSKDWGVSYSVGDVYDPDSKSKGLVATDVEVTGEGDYTVALDISGIKDGGKGSAYSFAFSALGISNAETQFPGYVIDIKEVLVNGKPYTLAAKPYTTSDDGKCMRVNLYNEWVKSIPDGIRTADGDTSNVSATPINRNDSAFNNIKTIQITFHFGPQN